MGQDISRVWTSAKTGCPHPSLTPLEGGYSASSDTNLHPALILLPHQLKETVISSSMLDSGTKHIPASILNVIIYGLLPLPSPPSNLVEQLKRKKHISSLSLKCLPWLRAPVG